MSNLINPEDIKTYDPAKVKGFNSFPQYSAIDEVSKKVVTAAKGPKGEIYLVSIMTKAEGRLS